MMAVLSADNQQAVDRLAAAMPSLERLQGSLRSKRFLGKVLGVHRQPSGRGGQIADGFVRLFEKAFLEYQAARSTLLLFLADGIADHEHRAQDHFESCVGALHRAIEYLERLRRLGYRKENGEPFIPKPRDIPVLSDSVRAQVRAMRDAIEHLDSDIIEGTFPEDAPVGIHLGWEQASLGANRLRYEDVAEWISQLHDFAVLLSRVQLAVRNPSA